MRLTNKGVITIFLNLLWITCALASLSSFIDGFANIFGYESTETKKSEEEPVRSKRQAGSIGDESSNMYEVTSSSLPTIGQQINTRYLPTISNGYIGATVFEKYMYLNGLYSGTGGNSHRAAIPAMMMTKINLTTPEIDVRAIRKYTLNARDGYFMETIDCEFAYIEHKMYMHQKYIRLFVSDVYVKMKSWVVGGGTLVMNYPDLNSSPDVTFDTPRPYLGNMQTRGITKEAEAGASVQTFFVYYMLPLTQVSVSGSNKEANYTHIMSVDKVQSNAMSDFDSAQKVIQQDGVKGNYQLFMEHVEAWRKTWDKGRIEIQGDRQLAKTTWMSQYYIISSLPSLYPNLQPLYSEVYYGCGRTGLGKGSQGKDYQGHIMWDNEFYIMPAILMFQPDLAKHMLRYRANFRNQAADNAKKYGAVGNNYPWESAFTGNDVTNPTCPATDPQCNWRRMFVSAGVSWAIRQYYSVTRDRDYMINPLFQGCVVAKDIAQFYANQVVYNPATARYDLNNITGPDDWHPNINNNAFTLCAASLAIHWARYFSCMCERNEREDVPDEYIHKALFLNLPYDNVKRLHYQFDGFDPAKHTPIKQADAIMLNYPLNWNYSRDIMKNDLEFYENYISPKTPAMTWSWFTIGWKWVNEDSKMRSYFLKSYQDYIIEPFKVWTEYAERTQSDQDVGNVNFLPGMGAFLQSLVNGFAGLRVRPDKLEFFNPILPPGATKLTLHGLKYMSTNMTITVELNKVTVQVWETVANRALVLRRNETGSVEESLTAGAKIEISPATSGFLIYPVIGETCEHPRDYIFMPWGYSPFVEGAMHCVPNLVAMIILGLTVIVLNLVRT